MKTLDSLSQKIWAKDSKTPFPHWLCISEKELSYGAGPPWSPAGLVTAVATGSRAERCHFRCLSGSSSPVLGWEYFRASQKSRMTLLNSQGCRCAESCRIQVEKVFTTFMVIPSLLTWNCFIFFSPKTDWGGFRIKDVCQPVSDFTGFVRYQSSGILSHLFVLQFFHY